MKIIIKRVLFFLTLGLIPFAHADSLLDGYLQQRANAFLTVISYSLTPDVTTGSLSLNSGVMNNPQLWMTSLGGGGTMSENFPLYLEGTIALSRYNPTFVTNSSNAVSSPLNGIVFLELGVLGGILS